MSKQILSSIVTLGLLLAGSSAQAAGLLPDCGGPGQSACTICNLFDLINNIIRLVIAVFVPIVAGLVTAIAGFMMIINRDKADSFNKAKEILLMTILGVVLIYGAYGLIYTIFGAMGYVKDPLSFSLSCQ